MSGVLDSARALLVPDRQSDRIVPPTGFTARLTILTSAAMAFLAVFAMALALASGRLAHRWGTELAHSATVRIIAPLEQQAAQLQAAMQVLSTTPGIGQARPLSDAEHTALLAPWLGNGLDLTGLPMPRLIELQSLGSSFDPQGLRLRLSAEAPGAVLDDHARWREPLERAATRLWLLGWLSMLLIAESMIALIALAANAALAANRQVVSVLRLVGATDGYIADAFVRRFTWRAAGGALGGTALAGFALLLLPSAGAGASVLGGLGPSGAQWLLLLIVPILSAAIAFFATRYAAMRLLERIQ